MARKAKSLIRKGTEGIVKSEGSGSSVFMPAIKDGQSVELVPMINMDELPSADVHEFWDVNPFVAVLCTGTTSCPGEEAGNDPRFRAYLPVITKEGEYKIFTMGIRLVRDLEEVDSALGGMAGHVIRFKRRGTGFATQYTPVPVGKKVDLKKHLSEMPDVEKELGPQTNEAIRAVLVERGLLEDVTSTKTRSKKKAEVEAPFDTDEDEEDEGDAFSDEGDDDTDDWGDL